MDDAPHTEAPPAAGYVPFDLVTGTITEDRHAQRRQDGDPAFVEIRLGWQYDGEDPFHPRVEVHHEHAGVERYAVGWQPPSRLHHQRAVELVLQYVQVPVFPALEAVP